MSDESPVTVEEALAILKRDVNVWNELRVAHPTWKPNLYYPIEGEVNIANAEEPESFLDNLSGISLRGADLMGVDFSQAWLPKANFIECDLRGANFAQAWLIQAQFCTADLRNVNFEGASLFRTNFANADLCDAYMGNVLAPDSNFSNANLKAADIGCACLFHSNFCSANLSGADLRGTHLSDNRGKAVDFTNSILKRVAFSDPTEDTFHHLACVKGLETAVFDEPQFLETYLTRVFDHVHKSRDYHLGTYPDFYHTILENISYLRDLFTTEEPPAMLVQVVHSINVELLSRLVRNPRQLNELGSRQFEELIAELLSSFGWDVHLTPQTKDGGYDIFAISKDMAGVRTSWIIECKKFAQDHKVGVEIARGLYAVKLDLRVANAMLATTSSFTAGVRAFKSSRYDFELRDYEGILEWINTYRPHPKGKLYIQNNRVNIR